ncbi:hypothetical protein IU486_06305 [Streptomyces gardneri]|uniref:hypothetical protein n=1 Tax=Nocardia TaxID=1817 RepID=UPI001359E2EE|nr:MULTISPECIES: hypothetical protein [Nocardia]MBF6164386.1 hypothetical protein [Streptomyces gardneri]MBF6204934.1 hypothetical protein [Streptomyces gardneri]
MSEGSESGEPVLVTLSTPARRSLVDGLVRNIGASPAAPTLELDAADNEIADFLAHVAHSDTGFVARTSSGERAVAIVAATAAALCGDDIGTALRNPDIAFLTSLKPAAVEAVRSVLLAVETETGDQVNDALRVLNGG